MPNSAATVVAALAGLSAPTIPAAVNGRLFRDARFRAVANVLHSGRACSAGEATACTTATASDTSATANALRLALDMTATEAAKLPGLLARGTAARALQLRLAGRGTTAAILSDILPPTPGA